MVVCAKMAEAELIEMLFGLWGRMGKRNHVLEPRDPETLPWRPI